MSAVNSTAAGAKIWLEVDDEDAWTLATVESASGAEVQLRRARAPENQPLNFTLPLSEYNKATPATGGTAAVADLTDLADVNVGAILHSLRLRYEKDRIYTAIGPIVIAVNPYKSLDVCSAEAIAGMNDGEESPDELPPHVFNVARSAYAGLCSTGVAQSILISGESGAGKTEAAKSCVSYIVSRSSAAAAASAAGGDGTAQFIEQCILQANPILITNYIDHWLLINNHQLHHPGEPVLVVVGCLGDRFLNFSVRCCTNDLVVSVFEIECSRGFRLPARAYCIVWV